MADKSTVRKTIVVIRFLPSPISLNKTFIMNFIKILQIDNIIGSKMKQTPIPPCHHLQINNDFIKSKYRLNLKSFISS